MTKLVRDKLKEKQGREYFHADGQGLQIMLAHKLYEEVHEVVNEVIRPRLEIDHLTEELADVEEVLRTIARHYGITPEQIEDVRLQKAEICGDFMSGKVIV